MRAFNVLLAHMVYSYLSLPCDMWQVRELNYSFLSSTRSFPLVALLQIVAHLSSLDT